MQSFLQALQQQQQPQHSSSESSDEELLDEVLREPSPPAIPRESQLAEDLALSSDENEGPTVSLLNSPALVEYHAHPVLPTEMSSQPKEEDFSDLLAPQD